VAGWSPPPLTVRDARRQAAGLRARLGGHAPPRRSRGQGNGTVAAVRDLVVRFGATLALRGVDLDLGAGEIVAIMGRNGAGKSTLLRALVGLARPEAGTVVVGGHQPGDLAPAALLRHVGLVPQEPADLLYADTVAVECGAADADSGAQPGTCAAVLDRLVPDLPHDRHPRDLSEGERLGLVLAIVLATSPPLLLLDEPTRGLDYAAKARLVDILRQQAASGRSVVLATHDVELAAEVATRTIVLADGEVVADGPTHDVVVGSPAFAPQVAKILAPLPWLTVSQVAEALHPPAAVTPPASAASPPPLAGGGQ